MLMAIPKILKVRLVMSSTRLNSSIIIGKTQCCFVVMLLLCTTCYFSSCRARGKGDINNQNNENILIQPFIVSVETVRENTDVRILINDPLQNKAEHACVESYSVDCGDGVRVMFEDRDFIHCYYANRGMHTISISGELHGLRLEDHSERAAYDEPYFFTDVMQWGDISWHNLSYFADRCKKLKITATDAPNLKRTESIERMFSDTTINSPLNHWDVSRVENMSGLFLGNEVFNQPLDKWDTSNVTNMSDMFHFAKAFNQPINNWNVSNVSDMTEMFRSAVSFNQSLSSWDVSNVLCMNQMFEGARSFHQDISSWDFSGIDKCIEERDFSDQYCITYMFTYSDLDQSHKTEYRWLDDRFIGEDVLCNTDESDCSLYDPTVYLFLRDKTLEIKKVSPRHHLVKDEALQGGLTKYVRNSIHPPVPQY